MVLIFHASDLHFGAEDPSALAWFNAQAHRHRPDAIVISGDLTMRARSSEFAAARDWLAALPAPVTVEVGNHDLPAFDILARFLRPYSRFQAIERFIERPIDLPGVAVIPLMTTARAQLRFNWSKGRVARHRLDLALRSLHATTQVHRLIVCHHPLVESGTNATARTHGGTNALAALAMAGATAVLSGHVHDPFDKTVWIGGKAIRLVGAGTLSERVRASAPSYNALSISDDRFDVEPRFAI